METTQIALFKGRQIRKILFNGEWWFSIVDIIEALTDSLNPNDYWYRMKTRVKNEDGIELSTFCRQLKLESSLGERSTTEIHRVKDSKGVKKLKKDSAVGDRIAGHARKELEKKLKKSVISKNNFKRLK